ncbi:hypothetical protein OIE48_40585 [Streptosporangium sp. NBC_01756]|nr:hypothetical protein [Streptosporangium sp. NBC_01756]WSC86575.1 hypothetical protein OIE48_40585 [Streptosporangium sp. NBC_01756]
MSDVEVKKRRAARLTLLSLTFCLFSGFAGVLRPRLVPLGVTLHAGRTLDLQLRGDGVQDLVRHLQRISQKAPEVANGHEPESGAPSDMPAAMPLDEGLVLVAEDKVFSISVREGGPAERPYFAASESLNESLKKSTGMRTTSRAAAAG